jgi:hypothetical protein
VTERERWIGVVHRLEELASDDPESPELPPLLAELDAAFGAGCDARAFATLYQAPSAIILQLLEERLPAA